MIYKVSTLMSVRSVIQNVMTAKVGTDFDKCNGWAATEVIEQGDGKWAKVCLLLSCCHHLGWISLSGAVKGR